MRRTTFIIAAFPIVLAPVAHADYLLRTWSTPNAGVWSDHMNWTPAGRPNNSPGGPHFLVDIGSPGGATCFLDMIATVSGLNIAPTHLLVIGSGRRLILDNTGGKPKGGIMPGAIHNHGVITLQTTGAHTYLQPAGGEVVLTGDGEIHLASSTGNLWIYPADALGSLVNQNNTIRGSGNLGWSNAPMAFTNHGAIRAQGTTPLTIAGAQPFVNTGSLDIDAGATLRLTTGTYDLTGTGIAAAESATLHIHNAAVQNIGEVIFLGGGAGGGMVEFQNATVTGGTWTFNTPQPAVDDGEMRIVTGTTLLDSPTINNAIVRILNNSELRLQGNVQNNSPIHVLSTNSHTHLAFIGDVVLSGGGSIEMSAAPNNWIFAPTAGSSLLNLDHAITGGGNIGWNSVPAPITNHALILANGGPNARLRFGMASTTFTNRGGIRAENDTTIILDGGTYDNHASFIDLGEGCTLDVGGAGNAVTIHDGEITMTAATMLLGNGTSIINCPIAANAPPGESEIHINGTVHLHNALTTADIFITNGRQLRLHGDAHSEGVIHVLSTDSHTQLAFVGDVVLSGGGSIEMSAAPNNRIFAPAAGSSLTNLDHAITGGGNIGWTFIPVPIDNHALILANGGPGARLAFASSMFSNRGGIRAENETTLLFHPGVYDSDDSFIELGEGCTMEVQSGAMIAGGEIVMNDAMMLLHGGAVVSECSISAAPPQGPPTSPPTSGSQILVANGSTARLHDVSADADIIIPNGLSLRVSGSIENAGTIHLNSAGAHTFLQPIGGDVTLSGGGSIVLSDFATNWIYRADSNDTVIHNLDNTIEGAGNLGWSGAPTGLVNHGTIRATGNQPLHINCNGPGGFVNHGLLEVVGEGGLSSAAGAFQTNGEFIIHPGSSVNRTGNIQQADGVTVIDGSLTMSNNLYQHSGGVVAGNGTLNNGTLVNIGGIVAPGPPTGPPTGSTGALAVASYTQNGGTLRIRLGGTAPVAEHDQLQVAGTADLLVGTLEIVHLPGYEPSKGDQFIVILGGSVSGAFNAVSGPGKYAVTYTPSSVIVTIDDGASCPVVGDLNCDGVVDVLDLLILLDAWGECADCGDCIADINGDCAVDVLDLLILLDNWG